jgi:hypothetical protein
VEQAVAAFTSHLPKREADRSTSLRSLVHGGLPNGAYPASVPRTRALFVVFPSDRSSSNCASAASSPAAAGDGLTVKTVVPPTSTSVQVLGGVF